MKHTDTIYSQWMKEPISLKRKSLLKRFGYFNALFLGFVAFGVILNIYSLLTVY
jgi:hypothetical protein